MGAYLQTSKIQIQQIEYYLSIIFKLHIVISYNYLIIY